MFKSALLVVFSCLVICIHAQPVISFEKTELDIGVVSENDDIMIVSIPVKNKGDQDLIIKDVSTSCGCMLVEYSSKPIPKDSSIILKVKINPNNRPGYFSKTVSITSNTKPDINLIMIKGVVSARPRNPSVEYPVKRGNLRFLGSGFNIGAITTEKPIERRMEIYNDSDKEIKLLPKALLPAHIQLVVKEQVLKPREVSLLKIMYDAKAKKDYGFVNDYMELYTDSPEDSLLPISVFGTIEDYFPPITAKDLASTPKAVVEKQEIYLGRYGRGTEVQGSFTIKNGGVKPLIIKKIKPSCSCVSATMASDKLEKQQSEILSFKIKTNELVGSNVKTITLFTNDLTRHVVVLTVRFDVF
jgi:hypothetical protein